MKIIKEINDQKTVRAFMAVEISDSIRCALAAAQNSLQYAGGHVSWTASQNIHCTLVFLGDLFPDAVTLAADALTQTAAAGKPFELEIRGLGYFGSARSPRIIWAGIAGQADLLIELQSKIAAATLQAGLKPDLKPFKPHLTIGRVRSARNAPALVAALEKHQDKSFGFFSVKQVVLMESRLTPHGPIYAPLQVCLLNG